jgi:hypothetical protein
MRRFAALTAAQKLRIDRAQNGIVIGINGDNRMPIKPAAARGAHDGRVPDRQHMAPGATAGCGSARRLRHLNRCHRRVAQNRVSRISPPYPRQDVPPQHCGTQLQPAWPAKTATFLQPLVAKLAQRNLQNTHPESIGPHRIRTRPDTQSRCVNALPTPGRVAAQAHTPGWAHSGWALLWRRVFGVSRNPLPHQQSWQVSVDPPARRQYV